MTRTPARAATAKPAASAPAHRAPGNLNRLQVIIGSTRPGRAADLVAPWAAQRATAHGAFEVEVIDLREWPLPMFAEHAGTIGDLRDPGYSQPIVRQWNDKLKNADAYLIVTPEYNHSIPGVLKNAIDNVFFSFAMRNKPVAAIAYSAGITGGARAIEHLAQVAIEAEMVPLRSTVIIPFVTSAFRPSTGTAAEAALSLLLDDLAWWSAALSTARTQGELPPAILRAGPPNRPPSGDRDDRLRAIGTCTCQRALCRHSWRSPGAQRKAGLLNGDSGGSAVGCHGRGRVGDQVVGVHDDRVGPSAREWPGRDRKRARVRSQAGSVSGPGARRRTRRSRRAQMRNVCVTSVRNRRSASTA
jgi:NAD(P)H-dependent FMN reductase